MPTNLSTRKTPCGESLFVRNLLCLCDLQNLFSFFRCSNISHLAADFSGRFFPDVVELGAANFRALDHLNFIYHGRIERENFFHAHTGGNVSDSKSGPRFPAVFARQDQALKSLQTSLALLHNFLPNAHSIS